MKKPDAITSIEESRMETKGLAASGIGIIILWPINYKEAGASWNLYDRRFGRNGS